MTGSALYQIQDGKPKLTAYASKRMPEAAKSYSITELEMCGLGINTASFAHLLKKVDFDAVVDHLAIMHIMRSKAEPATTRIKRPLELLSSYSLGLSYSIYEKTYGDAHAKLEKSSNFQISPGKTNDRPPIQNCQSTE